MKYQLVIQYPESYFDDYNDIVLFEDKLIDKLCNIGNLDGHDIGSGEINYFIKTDNPDEVFKILKSSIDLNSIKAAYREIKKDNYTIIWPRNYKGKFKIT